MNDTTLPSLSALRAFELAARSGSLSAAARTLNVTHAAIAQHVRRLEDHFGCTLLVRQGRGMVTTPEGETLAASLSEGFASILAGVRDLEERHHDRPVRVSLTPSFAENWLMPRLGGFWNKHPDIQVEIVPSPVLVDLRRDRFDLAIRYGTGPWSGYNSVELASANHVAIARPDVVAGAKATCLADLRDMHWLLAGHREEERTWAQSQGLDLQRARTSVFETGALAVNAARAGLGVMITNWAVAENEVKTGTMQLLCREEDASSAYHILTRPMHVSPGSKAFIAWLKKVAKQQL